MVKSPREHGNNLHLMHSPINAHLQSFLLPNFLEKCRNCNSIEYDHIIMDESRMDELLSELNVVKMQIPESVSGIKIQASQQDDVMVQKFNCDIDSDTLLNKAKELHKGITADAEEMQLWVSLNKFSGSLVPPEVTQPGARTVDAQTEMRRAWKAHKVAHAQFWDELDKRLVEPVKYDNTGQLRAAMTAFAQNIKAVVCPPDREREAATRALIRGS